MVGFQLKKRKDRESKFEHTSIKYNKGVNSKVSRMDKHNEKNNEKK